MSQRPHIVLINTNNYTTVYYFYFNIHKTNKKKVDTHDFSGYKSKIFLQKR